MRTKPFTAILFDLDDTLIDTSKYLVRPAMEKCFKDLVRKGVISSVQEGLEFELENKALVDKPLFFKTLIKSKSKNFTDMDRSKILDQVLSIYFSEPQPEMVKTFPDTQEILSALDVHYDLYLVSLGNPQVQQMKVKTTGLGGFFKHAWFPDVSIHHDKEITFRQVLDMTRIDPPRILCVGNRVDHEIKNGKALGMHTCWVEYGEHIDHHPFLHHEIPDFRIPSVRELIATCHL